MVTRYGQADIPREVSGRGRPAVGPAAADFPRDVCLTVSRNHAVFLFYPVLCPKLTLIQPTWSAYPYHLVFLIWYPYSLVFLIWYPYAPTSLYGNTAHCSGYGVAMGCYGLFIVTRTGIECTAITDRQSINSLLASLRFVTHFWEITPYILRDVIIILLQSQCYSINARAFGPRTPYRVGGLAGEVMRAAVSHSSVNHWIYNFKASLLSC